MRSMLLVLRAFADSVRPRCCPATAVLALILVFDGGELLAQQPQNNPQAPNVKAAIGPAGNQQNQNPLFAGPNMNLGQTNNSRGAAANADFDSLIDLIQATVANETWAENGGGTAEMRPFPGGVLVDAGGMLRLKYRRDRRPGLPIESPLTFYPRLAHDAARKLRGYWSIYRRFRAIKNAVKADPERASYRDTATTLLHENEAESLDLFHATRGGEAALARRHRDDAIRAGTSREAARVAAE